MSKYEQLIEFIINEQEDQARELFHQIVVEKSREIYESIIDEQDLEEIGGNPVEGMMDEVTMDQVGMAEDDEVGMDEPDMDMGDDMGDDMEAELDMDMGAEDGDASGALADAKEDIDAIFDRLMSQLGGEEEMDMDAGEEEMDMDSEEDFGDEDTDELQEASEDDDEEDDDEEDLQESSHAKKEEMLKDKKGKDGKRKMTEAEWLREYVDQIGEIYSQEPAQEEGHEVGAGKKAKVDKASTAVGPGVNMGGNVVKTKGGEQNPDGKQTPEPNNEYTKGKGNLPHAGKYQNTPGGNAGKTTFKSKESAKTGEEGGVNDKSPLAKA